MTERDMCEKISTEIEKRTGTKIPPRAIWDMSTSGELWPVFELYETLCGSQPERGAE